MGKLKSKLASILLSGVLLTSLIPGTFAFATTNTSPSVEKNAKSTLAEYLTAVKNKNYSVASSLYTDSRVKNENEKKSSFNELLKDTSNQIDSFIINDAQTETLKSTKITADITFKNGEEAQIPFSLKKTNDNWIVNINPNLDFKNDFNVTKEAKEINTIPKLSSLSKKVSFNFDLSVPDDDKLGSDTQYSIPFNVSSGTVYVNYKQWEVYTGKAKMEYAIVKKGLFFDTIYASGSVTGNNQSTYNILELSISGKKTDVCLRVTHLNPTYEAISKGTVEN